MTFTDMIFDGIIHPMIARRRARRIALMTQATGTRKTKTHRSSDEPHNKPCGDCADCADCR